MKRKRINFLVLLLVLTFGQLSAFAQTSRSYIIISFEDVYKVSQHGTKSYFWIIEKDSLKSHNFQPSYLFLNFSKQNLDDCCGGIDVDPFLVFPNSKYETDTLHSRDLKKLEDIILKNRKKIQVINKKWTSGQSETITVYAIPITGRFCSSNFHPIGQQRQGYQGRVYVPFSSFKYQDDFWKSPGSKFILNSDLSKLKFDAITY